MILFTPAKINIGLYVTQKRKDGYHDLETVFFPVPLYDVIEIVKADRFEIREYGIPSMCEPSENLCFRAWLLMHEKFSVPPVKINILKNIPIQSGLGGGSSDAVAVLKGLTQLFHIKTELNDIALSIGSDCPFFVDAVPSLALSRGEKLKPISVSLKGKWLLIFKPEFGMSTSKAFSEIVPKAHGHLAKDIVLPPEKWKRKIKNVFQDVFFNQFPEIIPVVESIEMQNPFFLSLSGSGSAFFALNSEPMKTEYIPEGWFVFQVRL